MNPCGRHTPFCDAEPWAKYTRPSGAEQRAAGLVPAAVRQPVDDDRPLARRQVVPVDVRVVAALDADVDRAVPVRHAARAAEHLKPSGTTTSALSTRGRTCVGSPPRVSAGERATWTVMTPPLW
ncbi:hypothetical protein GCM10009530_51060 [Microbispora corallina]|uniref:Uncharacterized protein n=1 Tax=Microbispora corallina TaxID=83302 RepID=A0ABQ4G6P5_9ACTN|nr:hypothetical protein Mco01_56990 [Microbispora corallina]